LGLLLLLLSVALRIAIPSGWMPAGGGLHIKPCVALSSAVTAHRPGSGHHGGSAPAQSHQESCAFAAFAIPLLAPAETWTMPPFAIAAWSIAAWPVARGGIGRALAAPPPPQTGPPGRF
jgi:hypothetical protein